MHHELFVQREKAIANPRVDAIVFREPASFPQLFKPEADDVADPGRFDAISFRMGTQVFRHQPGRPANRMDSASVAASAGFLNGCFAMNFSTEKSGFMAKHSAAVILARSMFDRRA